MVFKVVLHFYYWYSIKFLESNRYAKLKLDSRSVPVIHEHRDSNTCTLVRTSNPSTSQHTAQHTAQHTFQ
jgi:hypothetical protein